VYNFKLTAWHIHLLILAFLLLFVRAQLGTFANRDIVFLFIAKKYSPNEQKQRRKIEEGELHVQKEGKVKDGLHGVHETVVPGLSGEKQD